MRRAAGRVFRQPRWPARRTSTPSRCRWAQFARSGSAQVAVQAITSPALCNTLVKMAMASVPRQRTLRRAVLPAGLLVLASGGVALLLA